MATLRHGHGEFVMLKTQPTDGSAPLEFSSKFGSRLWERVRKAREEAIRRNNERP